MSFPPGKPFAALLIVAVLTGAFLTFPPSPARPETGTGTGTAAGVGAGALGADAPGADALVAGDRPLTLWTFAPTHAAAFAEILPRGSVHLVQARALETRLMTLLMADAPPEALPDLVQLEVNAAARFLRGPPQAVGLLPLEHRLAAAGLLDAIPAARLGAWTHAGHLYAVPWDLHPVALAYRRDLFEQAGIDLAAPATWEELHAALRAYRDFRRQRNMPSDAIELNRNAADHVVTLLLQRGHNLVTADGRVQIDHPVTLDTLCRLAPLLGGPGDVAAETPSPASAWVAKLADGTVAARLVPDWRLAYLARGAPELAGKVALRPLPIFEAGDAPTSTWGGIGMAIPADARDPDAAFELLVHLLASDPGLAARRRHTLVLPPTKEASEAFTMDAAYWGEDAAGTMRRLARQVPERAVSVHSPAAAAEVAHVLNRAAAYLDAGHDPAQLRPKVAKWLISAQKRVERRAARTAFDEGSP